ncbi:MAG: hypothetical protein FWG93_07755 [Oscillospiraceae bacterium]|nr:hypothetical protein [Oscillospiraceae bacterium]
MTRKISMFKLTTSLAMALILSLSLALPALADPPTDPITWDFGTEEHPAKAALTKILEMGHGTTTPTADFIFEFEPTSFDGRTTPEALATIPKIRTDWTVTLGFTGANTGTTVNGTKTIIRESGDLFEGINWPKTGVYVYTVSEREKTYTIDDEFKEDMIYSEAVYDLYVYVSEGKGGTRYVYAVGAVIVAADSSNEDDVGSKVDPTPKDPDVTGDYSKMVFTNTYLKRTTDKEDEIDKNAFEVSKEVEGAILDEGKYFEFSVTVSNPTVLDKEEQTYRAYVLNEAGAVVTAEENYASLGTDGKLQKYIEFETGQPLTVHLKHGQRLIFTDLYVGGSFTVTEAAEADYTPRSVLTLDGDSTNIPGAEGMPLTVPVSGVAYLGESTNSAAYTNAYKLVAPTGISVDNLPYAVMLLAALAALVIAMAVKARKRAGHGGR